MGRTKEADVLLTKKLGSEYGVILEKKEAEEKVSSIYENLVYYAMVPGEEDE